MTDFNKSVFINCPFDDTYHALLHSMLFTIVALGFQPRIAIESSDAGEIRLDKIISLVRDSRYSIHDLSRIKSTKKGEFFRLNMPFELGLDFGCRKYSASRDMSNKKFLVLSGEKHEYMKALSDISGIDIQYHDNLPQNLIKAMRHWFVANTRLTNSPSPTEIWYKSLDFNAEYILFARKKGYSADDMYDVPINEQIDMMYSFLVSNPFH